MTRQDARESEKDGQNGLGCWEGGSLLIVSQLLPLPLCLNRMRKNAQDASLHSGNLLS